MNNPAPQSFLSEIAERSPFAYATVAGGLTTLVVLIMAMIPGLNVIVLIIVMLPLWFIQNFGGYDLGRELNGFFIPNKAGWVFIFTFIWLIWLVIGFKKQRHLIKERQQQS